jgi:hypothetical protein
LIAEHPNDLRFCDNPKCIREGFRDGKVASMIGIEVRNMEFSCDIDKDIPLEISELKLIYMIKREAIKSEAL